jgi:cation transport protein ChaC
MSTRGQDVASREVWIFGYGSLMWRPGFAFEEAVHARLVGWRRCFCIYSILYRGTPERPGLVLGLDRGGTCEGIAFRVAPENAAQALDYVRRRELVTGVYREALVPVEIMSGERPTVYAVTYIAERAHPSYAGQHPVARQAQLIAEGYGISGSNIDYLRSTLGELQRLNIRERELERVTAMVGRRAGTSKPQRTHKPAGRNYGTARGGQECVRQCRHWKPLKRAERTRFLHRKVLGVVR